MTQHEQFLPGDLVRVRGDLRVGLIVADNSDVPPGAADGEPGYVVLITEASALPSVKVWFRGSELILVQRTPSK
jgi:hypothetical protein